MRVLIDEVNGFDQRFRVSSIPNFALNEHAARGTIQTNM